MNFIDSLNIHNYHQLRIKQYGAGNARTLGWKSQEGQMARFEVLAQIADLTNASVLDAGCGYGDLCGFLQEKFTGLRYIGVDMEESFLDLAIEQYGKTGETSFFLGDFTKTELPVTDYILASGVLNYKNSDPAYIFKTIAKLYNGCRFGFGFNLLSKVTDPKGLITAYEPKEIVEFCKTLTSEISLKEGYYEHDFTVMMYHS